MGVGLNIRRFASRNRHDYCFRQSNVSTELTESTSGLLTFDASSDGTPILQWDNALSYVCYFVFVWWIWVAQVAYNMRFRQADWLHRIWVFAQLIVFSALAAFTKDFDVTNGLANDSDNSVADLLFSQLGNSKKTLAASNFRNERLPRLNARGASFVMGVSRLVLLVQYSVGMYSIYSSTDPRSNIVLQSSCMPRDTAIKCTLCLVTWSRFCFRRFAILVSSYH